ncbi:methyl-accepting chemotaxis protein [Clostridium hydrogenum]|uniref:methyl-accepting chemotaxis protein n=1 Tax=Clostridium hydrogenum TaxID=2855764 RepID=UPI001F1A077E|nr:methyl-accepting chemotaxis protein [Clostridium hydrogenum]
MVNTARNKTETVVNKKDISLKRTSLTTFLFIGIIPLAVFSFIFFIIIKNSIHSNQISAMKQISSMATENVDKWGDDNILLAEDLAGSQVVGSGNLSDIQTEFKAKLAGDTSILNIMYADIQGNVLTDGLGSINLNIKDQSYFNEAIKGNTYVSNVFIDKNSNNPIIVFAAPVKKDNHVIGTIVNEMNVSSIDSVIGNIFFAKHGVIYTFDRKGNITFNPDKTKIMKENIIDSGSDGLKKSAESALRGNMNSSTYSIKGQSEEAVYNYIPSLGWGTMTTIPTSELYAGFIYVLEIAVPLFIILVAGIIVIAWKNAEKLVTPIAELNILTKKVADGDLTVKADINGAKEIVEIGNSFNAMISSLKNLTSDIYIKNDYLKEASENLDSISSSTEDVSKDISKAMEEVAVGATSQANKMEEVLVNVQDLDTKMDELSIKIIEISNALKNSEEALDRGQNDIKSLEASTNRQQSIVKETVKEVNELETSVVNVDKIIGTIGDIAAQTNLLALNASIEAARAGESGKGFAVVAGEVGKLANESQTAANEISTILKDIRSKTNNTTNLMNSLVEAMKLQSETVTKTINLFSDITFADKSITENIQTFNKLIEYISTFSNNVLEVVETLSSISEQCAAATEEVTASTQDQLTMVEKLRKSSIGIGTIVKELEANIEKFKIDEEIQ